LMKPDNPLEQFEFQPAAQIRKPTPPERPRRPGRPVSRWVLWALMIMSLALAGLVWFQINRMQQLESELARTVAARDEAMQASAQLKMEMEAADRLLKDLSRKLDTSSKGKGQLLDTIESLTGKLKRAESDRKQVESARDRYKAQWQDTNRKLKQAETTIANQKRNLAQVQKEKDELEAQLDESRDAVDKLQREIKTLRGSMNQEGEASRKLAGELLRKEGDIQKLQSKIADLESRLNEVETALADCRRVDEGELTPLSDRVTPAKPLVNPPVIVEKKGLFSKARGYVLVNALIDEVGLVRNAVFMEEHLENVDQPSAIISRALAQVMKWKFSPALYDGATRVQVWQAVPVPVRSE